METKNLKKIVTKRHNWDFGIEFNRIRDFKWDMIFVTVSFALAITSYVGMGESTSVSGFLVSYISMVVMLVAFSINFVNLFQHIVLMVCGCYHVIKQNVEEQKDIDYGTTTTFYDTDTKKQYSESEYLAMVRADMQKDMEEQSKKNGEARIQAEMARKEFERKACTVPHGDEVTDHADPKPEENGAN